MTADPRATQIYNNLNQDEDISQVITKLQKSSQINAFFVLSNFIDCPEIKNEPQFFNILFSKNMETVIELVQWMLIPKQLIKRKKIKTNVDSYPYQCRELLKDNWCFYEKIYFACRSKKLQLTDMFKFLRKEFYDSSTIFTSLGYFSQTLTPLSKYDFSSSYQLKTTLNESKIAENSQTFSILKILPQILIKQLIGYCHYEPIFQFIRNAIIISLNDAAHAEQSKKIQIDLLKFWQVQHIFAKFSPNNSNIQQVSKYVDFYQIFYHSLRQLYENLQLTSSNVVQSKDTSDTINNNQSTNNKKAKCWIPQSATFTMLQCMIQSNFIEYCVKQLLLSKYCGLPSNLNLSVRDKNSSINIQDKDKEKQKQKEKDREKEKDNKNQRQPSVSSTQGISLNQINTGIISQPQQDQLVQIFIKILQIIAQIYYLLPKYSTSKQQQISSPSKSPQIQKQISIQSILNDDKFLQPSAKKRKSKKQIISSQYTNFIKKFHEQIQYLFNNMQFLTKFVYIYSQQGSGSTYSKIVPFASGENVRGISMLKFKYFRLLLSCLRIKNNDKNRYSIFSNSQKSLQKQQKQANQRQKQQKKQIQQIKIAINTEQETVFIKQIKLPQFQLNIQKLYVVEIIKKYLTENRWNNIAQHVLIRICHTLILNNYDDIKKNIEKDKNKKFSDSFLAYLIQNFTKRDFVFLNTVKFTSQGNLFSLYKIAKDLAYSLNSTNQLFIFINQFEPWKKFIMNDLKNYQQKLFPKAIMPDSQDNQEDELKLKVDQADSIKKLIQNISTAKWPNRQTNTKILSKTTNIAYRNSFDNAKSSKSRQRQRQKNAMQLSNHKQKEKKDFEGQFDKFLEASVDQFNIPKNKSQIVAPGSEKLQKTQKNQDKQQQNKKSPKKYSKQKSMIFFENENQQHQNG